MYKGPEWTEPIEFTQVLGSGSFGVVLKATATSDATSSTSAVKIIFSECSSDQEVETEEQEKTLREVKTVLGKQHENIVTTTNFADKFVGHEDIDKIFRGLDLEEEIHEIKERYTAKAKRLGPLNTIWIQMELCGYNLRSWLNNSKHFDVNNKLHTKQCGIVTGLVEGLKYLHQNKIIHRDFKPENIFFSKEYSLPVKIGDFGLSRELHNQSLRSRTLTPRVGTLDYMAPEVLTGKYSFQADLLSLGLVMWEVVQLIGSRERMGLFDKLVNGDDQQPESLVNDHPFIVNGKEVIIKLTRRRIQERAQSITQIYLNIKLHFLVSNSEQLRQRLLEVKEGDIIELDEGEYEGPFVINLNMLILRGRGEGTVFKKFNGPLYHDPVAVIRITGNNCQVLCAKVICDNNEFNSYGIKLFGSGNRVEDIKFQGGWNPLHVVGGENTLSNLSISNSYNGILIKGSANKVDKIRVQEVNDTGIIISGHKNELDMVSCNNVKGGGMYVRGDNNRLTNVDCHNSTLINASLQGVFITAGSGTFVDNLNCSGFSNYGLFLDSPTSKSLITNSVCDRIKVDGSAHSFINVDGGTLIAIRGTVHRLENCTANKYINEGADVTKVGCNF